MLIYDKGTIEIGGLEYETEVYYEIYDGSIIIHDVVAVKVYEGIGCVWYGPDGKQHKGKMVDKVVVTKLCNENAWKEEIAAYLDYLNSTGE